MMNNRRIFIAKPTAESLARMAQAEPLLVTCLQFAAMGASASAEHERADFYMFIDELHNFSTDSFASLLSESRKYRLCLTLSHQYSAQLREEVRRWRLARKCLYGSPYSLAAKWTVMFWNENLAARMPPVTSPSLANLKCA